MFVVCCISESCARYARSIDVVKTTLRLLHHSVMQLHITYKTYLLVGQLAHEYNILNVRSLLFCLMYLDSHTPPQTETLERCTLFCSAEGHNSAVLHQGARCSANRGIARGQELGFPGTPE